MDAFEELLSYHTTTYDDVPERILSDTPSIVSMFTNHPSTYMMKSQESIIIDSSDDRDPLEIVDDHVPKRLLINPVIDDNSSDTLERFTLESRRLLQDNDILSSEDLSFDVGDRKNKSTATTPSTNVSESNDSSTTTTTTISPVRWRQSAFTTNDITILGVAPKERILSELLYHGYFLTTSVKRKAAIASLSIESLGKVSVGTIGLYRRIVPRTTKREFSWIEEMRIITAIGLYGSKICILLCPVISIIEGIAKYDKISVVKIVLYDEGDREQPQKWIKVVKNGYFIRGCSFVTGNRMILRSIVVEGIYHEISGRRTYVSAQGMVPQRFVTLLTEAADNTLLFW